MVNTGKPSRACQTCKTRRVKCDLTRPACIRCQKTGRQCPGIPDDFDVVLVNQSRSVKAKVDGSVSQRASASVSASPVSSADSEESPIPHGTHELVRSRGVSPLTLPPPSPSHDLALTGESQAVSLFLDNFVISPTAAKFMNPYLERLTVMFPYCHESEPLHHATVAVSTMILSFYEQFAEARPYAVKAYGKTLQLVGAAIKDPEQARSNGTLMAVLLLSLYEMLSFSKTASTSYKNHVAGALSLMRMRDSSNATDEETLKIFRSVRGELIMGCVQSGMHVDDPSSPSIWFSPEIMPATTVMEQLDDITVNTCNLIADAKAFLSNPETTTNSGILTHLLTTAYMNDQTLLCWFQNLPTEYDYGTVASFEPLLSSISELESALLWPGIVHIYTDIFVSKTLNEYRVFRIYLQCVILQCLTRLDQVASPPPLTPTAAAALDCNMDLQLGRDRATYILQTLVDDICASVPFHMGLPPAIGPSYFGMRTQMTTAAMGGYFLMRPLFVASGVGCISVEQRTWIKGRLRAIANMFSFEQARILSDKDPLIMPEVFPHNNETTGFVDENIEIPISTSQIEDFILYNSMNESNLPSP